MQRFVPIEALLKGRHFDRQIIILCVSWYTRFKLSLRDLVIMMADRGIPYGPKTRLSSSRPFQGGVEAAESANTRWSVFGRASEGTIGLIHFGSVRRIGRAR